MRDIAYLEVPASHLALTRALAMLDIHLTISSKNGALACIRLIVGGVVNAFRKMEQGA